MRIKFTPKRSWLIVPALVVLAGCSSDSDYDFEDSLDKAQEQAAAASPPEALFNPTASTPVVPFPSNLLFSRSTDGTINIPVADDTPPSNPAVALNQLDGFSTVAPIATAVSEPLDPASLVMGSSVLMYEVVASQGLGVESSVRPITAAEMVVAQSGSQLVMVPTVPLKPATSYMVVLTDDIMDVDGTNMRSSLTYRLLKGDTVLASSSAEALRAAVGTHINLLSGTLGVDTDKVVLSWVFTTQSTREVLQSVKDNTTAQALTLASNMTTTSDWNAQLQGKADVYQGALDLPYYLTAAGTDVSPLAVINSFWQNSSGGFLGAIGDDDSRDYTPEKKADVTVPVLMTLPNANSAGGGVMPTNGWPVTIFQHGITRNRTDMLLIADAMADAGRAVIAIDIPLHGLIDASADFHASSNDLVSGERTFDLDLVTIDAETGLASPGSDSVADPSGQHFLNLGNLANSRDNLRQAVSDLFTLTASLSGAQLDAAMLDANNINFVGHSLGGIVGTTMLSYENQIQSATLAMPGGGIAQLLANSDSFAPIINAGLAGNGVMEGTADYQQFLIAAQTLLDSADSINHAGFLAQAQSTRLHLIEVVGDAVIPNNAIAAGQPLAGTDPLIRLLGLPIVAESTTESAAVRFSAGDHGSIINPTASVAATVEMQTQMATFAATGGTVLPINDTSVIQPLDAAQ